MYIQTSISKPFGLMYEYVPSTASAQVTLPMVIRANDRRPSNSKRSMLQHKKMQHIILALYALHRIVPAAYSSASFRIARLYAPLLGATYAKYSSAPRHKVLHRRASLLETNYDAIPLSLAIVSYTSPSPTHKHSAAHKQQTHSERSTYRKG